MLPEIDDKRTEIIKERCKSNGDLIAVATVYATQAYMIWKAIGGEKMVAKQFQAWSDRCETRTAKQTIFLMVAASFLVGVVVGASVQ